MDGVREIAKSITGVDRDDHCRLLYAGAGMTRSIEAALAAARRAGAEEMRERAARKAGSLFAISEETRDELSASDPDHEDLISADTGDAIELAIRALPLEG